jgi:Cephalosporin hydroxylase
LRKAITYHIINSMIDDAVEAILKPTPEAAGIGEQDLGHDRSRKMSQAEEYYEKTKNLIKQLPTEIQGLKYFPSLEPEISNDQDQPAFGWVSSEEISDDNLRVMRDVVSSLGADLHAAMEIGVNRNGERSMSRVIMDDRPAGSFYLGIDIEDKSYLNDPSTNTHTLQCSSGEQAVIRTLLKAMRIEQLDLLMIDGWHSVNMTVNDWRYAELVRPGGYVVLHDTNSHPGCVATFEAVDEALWEKQRFSIDKNDFGIATFKRK